MSIPNAIIDEVKSRIDIVDVIGDFVDLKKSGQSFKALSPFTNEKTPSFFVSPAKGIFKCFSSGKGGDAISFLMEYDGLSYIEAIRYLAEKYGIEIREEEETDEEVERRNERESLFIALNYANDRFQSNLWESDEGKNIGLSYLRERKLKDEVIRTFQLGYAMEKWDDLLKNATDAGYQEDILEKAGLLSRKDERVFDRFRGRVIFPIHNLSGKVIAFGARTLKKEGQPKYLNSPETDVYHKSRILYGIYQARQDIRNEDNCILVEGYTDVIALHEAGIRNVVASSGTSLTEDQIRLISRFTNNVTVVFDGDVAGIKASLRGIDLILAGGLNVKAVVIPEGQDPDSYSRELGVNAFRDFLDDQAQDFIRFKAGLFAEEAKDDPVKKAGTIREIVESIAKIPDSIKRSVYLKETSSLLGIDESVLIAEQNKILIKDLRQKDRQIPVTPVQAPPVPSEKQVFGKLDFEEVIALQERESIRLLLKYGDMKLEDEVILYQYLLNELEEIEFTTPVFASILHIYQEQLSKGNIPDSDFFINYRDELVKRTAIDLLTDKEEVSDHWTERFKIPVGKEEDELGIAAFKNALRIKRWVVLKRIHENQRKLKEEKNAAELNRLMQVHTELTKIKSILGKELGIVING